MGLVVSRLPAFTNRSLIARLKDPAEDPMEFRRSTPAREARHGATFAATLLSAVAALAFIAPAAAQEKFPSRPIEMIVPTAPGGGTDITARVLAENAEATLGVKVVVVNVPGATGGVGVGRLVAAKPDGYTVAYVWNAPITIVPHTLSVTYGPQSFMPVTQTTGGTPLIFCVNPSFPAANGKEFVDLLKANPGKYTYGNDGTGGMVQLAGERLFQPLGIKLRAVPFTGAGETLKAFLGGHVDIYGGAIPTIGPYMKEGKAKCLLVTTKDRNPAAPDAIGAGELGLADRQTELWRGVIAPKDIPAERLKILEDGFRKAANAQPLKDYTEKTGEKVVAGSSAEFQKLIASEYKDFGSLVQALGLGAKK
jgi:putative tricarboxylic transport membrane protein